MWALFHLFVYALLGLLITPTIHASQQLLTFQQLSAWLLNDPGKTAVESIRDSALLTVAALRTTFPMDNTNDPPVIGLRTQLDLIEKAAGAVHLKDWTYQYTGQGEDPYDEYFWKNFLPRIRDIVEYQVALPLDPWSGRYSGNEVNIKVSDAISDFFQYHQSRNANLTDFIYLIMWIFDGREVFNGGEPVFAYNPQTAPTTKVNILNTVKKIEEALAVMKHDTLELLGGVYLTLRNKGLFADIQKPMASFYWFLSHYGNLIEWLRVAIEGLELPANTHATTSTIPMQGSNLELR